MFGAETLMYALPVIGRDQLPVIEPFRLLFQQRPHCGVSTIRHLCLLSRDGRPQL
jgi:hypothetical protein